MPPSSPSPYGDIPPEEFLRQAQTLSSWIARYLADPERYPILAQVAPGEIRAGLPREAPTAPESLDAILADLERVVLPGVTHWNHPGFLAYFATNGSTPGILAELLSAALNQVGILWRTSPILAELEQTATDWLRIAFGLPDGWFGMISDTASTSTLLALAAAREQEAGLDIRHRGMSGRPDLPAFRIYCSEHAHSSVDKAAITLGIGLTNVVRIGADTDFRMRSDLLEAAIAADRAAGHRPLAIVATIGTTSATSIDPVPAIGEIARREGCWLHVDAAYGGALALVPERRELFAGVAEADSLVVNPHKWIFTPMDCSVLWTRRPEVLKRTFALTPAYLTTQEQEVALSYSDYSFQLGRRFRALKLWFVLRAFGLEGIADRLRHHCALATTFAGWVRANPEWQVMAPVPMSVVCLRHVPPGVTDEETLATHNARILESVNRSGRIFLSHTKLDGRYVLRVAIGSLRTEERHLADCWALLREGALG